VIRFVFVVLLFAVMVYLLVRLMDRRTTGRAGPVIRKRPQQRPRRTVAPDDDEEFLRDLDKKRKNPEDPAA
jgi:hypothetical protein